MNTITVVRKRFKSQEEYEAAILDVIKVLLANRYQMSIHEEDGYVTVIQFDAEDPDLADKHLVWLSYKELESIVYDD